MEDLAKLRILLEKHGLLDEFDAAYSWSRDSLAALRAALLPLREERTQDLLAEVVQTYPYAAHEAGEAFIGACC